MAFLMALQLTGCAGTVAEKPDETDAPVKQDVLWHIMVWELAISLLIVWSWQIWWRISSVWDYLLERGADHFAVQEVFLW